MSRIYLTREEALEKKVNELTPIPHLVNDTDEYAKQVSELIRMNYSLTAEIAILRKTLKLVCDSVGIDYEQFNEYNSRAEEAKQSVSEQELQKQDL